MTWFGGEPLLGLPVILDLAARFDALVEEGVLPAWSSTLVTNGLMATPTTMARLAGVPLRSIQVTIDGPREVHDRRRALESGKSSFDIICHNLARLPSGLATAIRVNVDAHNAGALET